MPKPRKEERHAVGEPSSLWEDGARRVSAKEVVVLEPLQGRMAKSLPTTRRQMNCCLPPEVAVRLPST